MSADDNFVKVIIVYDPLDVDNRKTVELEYQPSKALSHYLSGLPEDVEWGVALNGAHVPAAGLALTFPKKHDTVIVAPVLHGDDKGGILAIVATIALAAFAPWAAGALGFTKGTVGFALVSAGISIAGGLLINSFLPKPDTDLGGESQQTFGIDGPKNTSVEGVPVPIIYGKHGFGGNILDLYTENATDTDGKSIQFLYGRVAVSEGPIKSISDLRFNDQPVENFEDTEIDYRLGTGDQTVSEWFDETITLFNQARDFTTTWQTYTTVGEVDKLRLDVVFPQGLVFIDNEGDQRHQPVTLEMQYRELGTSTWLPFAANVTWSEIANDGSVTDDKFRVTFTYQPDVYVSTFGESGQRSIRYNNSPDPNFELQYRVNGGAWQTHKTYTSTEITNNVDGTTISETIDGFGNDGVEFRLVDNATPTGTQGPATLTINKVEAKTAVNEVTVEEKSTAAVRRSFKTDKLKQAQYEVRFRRTNEEDERTNVQDKVSLSDVGEIVLDPVALNYTAWVGYKVKMSGQLNGVPKLTGTAEGRIMPIYDQEGNLAQIAYSRNPADVVIDAYTSQRSGGKMELERIDFPAFAEWRQFCIDNNLTFDGNFTEFSNIDDAIKHAYIAGRAQRIAVGARVSVAIDGPADPVMVFNSSLIERGSLEISYLPFSERINDISVSFFDEDDLYRQRTVRAVNDAALARGEPLKSASVSLKGITQRTRAQREANFRMNYNRLVTRKASWVAPMHALHCTVGDVALLQTEMVEWNEGGMLKSGSSSTHLKLDRPVIFESGKSYAVMVHRDTRKIADVSITNQTSAVITVDQVLSDDGSARRIKIGTDDYAILRVMPGSTTTDLLIEKGVTGLAGSSAEIWSTDVLDEVTVTHPGAGEHDTLDLASPLTDGAPPAYCAFIFGEISTLKKPFRITNIKKEEETKAKLDAVEYVSEIYNDGDSDSGTLLPQPVTGEHVSNLAISENNPTLQGGARRPELLVTWQNSTNGQHIAALVQYSVDGGRFKDFDTTSDESAIIPVDSGAEVTVRVIAKTPDGFLPVGTAPTVTHQVSGYTGTPEAPLGWTAIPGFRSIKFSEPDGVDRQTAPYDTQLMFGDSTFGAFQLWEASQGDIFANATKVADFKADTFTLDLPINAATKTYWVTVTDSAGNISPESVSIDAGPEIPRTVALTTDAQVFAYESGGINPSPSSATVSATASNTTAGATVYYEFMVNGASQANTTSNTFSYTPQTDNADMPDRIEVIIRENDSAGDALARDEITMLGAIDGVGSVLAILSNQAHTVPTDENGNNTIMSGSGTRISVFYGTESVTYDGVGTSEKTFAVSTQVIQGTITIGGITADVDDAVVADHSAFGTDVAVIRYTISGTANGQSFARTIDQTLTKARAGQPGIDGDPGITFEMNPASVVLPADSSGNVTSYANSGTQINVKEGGDSLNFIASTLSGDLVDGSWQIFDTDVDPLGDITVGNISDGGNDAQVADHSGMVLGTDVVKIRYNIRVKRNNGDLQSFNVTQTISKAKAGTDGVPGNTNAPVAAYRRDESAPGTPTDGSYNFDTNTLTPPTSPDQWYAEPPSTDGNPLWVTNAMASIAGTSGTDSNLSWSTPAKLVEDGAKGNDAKLVRLTADKQIFTFDQEGNAKPVGQTITLTAAKQNTTSVVTFSASPSVTLSGTGDSRTLDIANFGGNDSVTITATVDGVEDRVTIYRVQDAPQAITVVISNESHVLPADSDGNVSTYSGSGSEVRIYQGDVLLDYVTTGTNPGTWQLASANPVNIDNGFHNDAGSYLDIFDHANMTADNAYVDYTFTGYTLGGDQFSITKRRSFSKSRAGQNGVGTDAKVVRLTASGQVFTFDGAGNADPASQSVDLTASLQGLTGTVTWSTSPLVTLGGTGNARTLSMADFGSNNKVTITAELDGVQDQITIYRLSDGAKGADGTSPITMILTNESHTIPARSDGTTESGDYGGSGTDVLIYEGDELLHYNGSGTTPGTWDYSLNEVDISAGIVLAVDSGEPDGDDFLRLANASGMSNGSSTAYITITATGQRLDGTSFTVSKRQSFTKSREGASGARGPGEFWISITAITDADTATKADTLFNSNIGTPAENDVAVFYTGTATSPTDQKIWYFDGTSWSEVVKRFKGDVLIDGTVIADALVLDGSTVEAGPSGQLRLKDLGVGTGKVADDAITVGEFDSSATLSSNTTNDWQAATSISLTVSTVTDIFVFWYIEQSYPSGFVGPEWGVRLKKNGTVVTGTQRDGMQAANDYPSGVFELAQESAGSKTLSLDWKGDEAGSSKEITGKVRMNILLRKK